MQERQGWRYYSFCRLSHPDWGIMRDIGIFRWTIVRESGRLRIGLLRPILGEEEKTAPKPKNTPKKSAAPKSVKKTVKKPKPKKVEEVTAAEEIPQKAEKPEEPKKKKKELSVWLL